jgi:hypothetical protein
LGRLAIKKQESYKTRESINNNKRWYHTHGYGARKNPCRSRDFMEYRDCMLLGSDPVYCHFDERNEEKSYLLKISGQTTSGRFP